MKINSPCLDLMVAQVHSFFFIFLQVFLGFGQRDYLTMNNVLFKIN